MPINTTTRPVTANDDAFLYDLYKSSREIEMSVVPWSDQEKESFLQFQFAAQQNHYREQFESAEHVVVLSDSAPIGRLYVDRRKGEIRILDIALLPDHRGRGVGTRLLVDLIDEARATSSRLTIYVETYQRSVNLFKRLGFAITQDEGVSLLMAWSPDVA